MVIVLGEKTWRWYDTDLNLVYCHGSKSIDKIVKIKFLQDSQEIVILYAHNWLETFGIQNKSLTFKTRQFCTEECILYTGDVNSKNQMVASGTVFSSILLWKIQNDEKPSPVLYRLEGHTGVIFDVRFCKSKHPN